MTDPKLKDVIEKMGSGLEQFTKDTRADVKKLVDRMDSLEAKSDRPGMITAGDPGREMEKSRDIFYRTGAKTGSLLAAQPKIAGLEGGVVTVGEQRAMSIGSDSAGGHTVINDLDDEIISAVGGVNPIFNDVRQVKTDSNAYDQLFTVTAPAAQRSAESSSRTATDTPVIAKVTVSLYDLNAVCVVSNELLDSSQFNISRYLREEVERQFGDTLESEICTGAGTGSQQALGINTQATSTSTPTSSPELAFGTYRRMGLGTDSPLSTFSYDSLAQLVMAVPARYRRESKFYGSQSAIQVMRRFLDGNSNPIWVDASGVTGRPQNLMGYEVHESSGLPAVAYGAQPLFFGNLDRSYLFASHNVGVRLIRDPYTTKGSTTFYFSLFCGGTPSDTRGLVSLHVA